MKLRHCMSVFGLLISACTVTPEGSNLNAQFHPPLTYQHWQMEHYTLQNGAKACSLSSGYNGLTVIVSNGPAGETLFAESNRRMEPGATFTVTTDRGNFHAYDSVFPPQLARKLVNDLAKGGTAYLEWSELSGPTAAERVHVQNMVQLNDFAARLKNCRDSLAGGSS